jgi:Ca2+-binding EF-hand superfamily protein
MKPMSCKIKASDFFDALENLRMNLDHKEKAAIEKKFDPENSGTLNLAELVQNETKN